MKLPRRNFLHLAAGLGEMEIKAESMRFIACVGGDLLQDAAFTPIARSCR